MKPRFDFFLASALCILAAGLTASSAAQKGGGTKLGPPPATTGRIAYMDEYVAANAGDVQIANWDGTGFQDIDLGVGRRTYAFWFDPNVLVDGNPLLMITMPPDNAPAYLRNPDGTTIFGAPFTGYTYGETPYGDAAALSERFGYTFTNIAAPYAVAAQPVLDNRWWAFSFGLFTGSLKPNGMLDAAGKVPSRESALQGPLPDGYGADTFRAEGMAQNSMVVSPDGTKVAFWAGRYNARVTYKYFEGTSWDADPFYDPWAPSMLSQSRVGVFVADLVRGPDGRIVGVQNTYWVKNIPHFNYFASTLSFSPDNNFLVSSGPKVWQPGPNILFIYAVDLRNKTAPTTYAYPDYTTLDGLTVKHMTKTYGEIISPAVQMTPDDGVGRISPSWNPVPGDNRIAFCSGAYVYTVEADFDTAGNLVGWKNMKTITSTANTEYQEARSPKWNGDGTQLTYFGRKGISSGTFGSTAVFRVYAPKTTAQGPYSTAFRVMPYAKDIYPSCLVWR